MTGSGGRLAWRGRLLAVALLAFFLRGVDWGPSARRCADAGKLPLVGLVVVTIGVYSLRAWRWGYLLRPLGARAGFADLFSATVVGFMSGLLVPRAGEILRPYLIGHGATAIQTSAGFASIILERLFDLITVLVLFALYLYVLPAPAAPDARAAARPAASSAAPWRASWRVGVTRSSGAFHAHAERRWPGSTAC